jgi:hypothetical protein
LTDIANSGELAQKRQSSRNAGCLAAAGTVAPHALQEQMAFSDVVLPKTTSKEMSKRFDVHEQHWLPYRTFRFHLATLALRCVAKLSKLSTGASSTLPADGLCKFIQIKGAWVSLSNSGPALPAVLPRNDAAVVKNAAPPAPDNRDPETSGTGDASMRTSMRAWPAAPVPNEATVTSTELRASRNMTKQCANR